MAVYTAIVKKVIVGENSFLVGLKVPFTNPEIMVNLVARLYQAV